MCTALVKNQKGKKAAEDAYRFGRSGDASGREEAAPCRSLGASPPPPPAEAGEEEEAEAEAEAAAAASTPPAPTSAAAAITAARARGPAAENGESNNCCCVDDDEDDADIDIDIDMDEGGAKPGNPCAAVAEKLRPGATTAAFWSMRSIPCELTLTLLLFLFAGCCVCAERESISAEPLLRDRRGDWSKKCGLLTTLCCCCC